MIWFFFFNTIRISLDFGYLLNKHKYWNNAIYVENLDDTTGIWFKRIKNVFLYFFLIYEYIVFLLNNGYRYIFFSVR